ncbi:hypothetical protein CTAYLR_008313 [Chrysophaeum taylorii]|uniref:Methyltransferase domain-containing protein n=1 Tax=Chrysophaeum taylorii TaxID=2483200 RepID=A0AAD7UA77_9STRA|nr:hypothetical protein CTAYLR_008313 [Chrysophaeum taylorii]
MCPSSKTASTLRDYDAVAEAFDAGNRDHDVSQNIEALVSNIATSKPWSILDLGCAGGRDLETFARLGHEAIGVEGAPCFVELARQRGLEVWCQDFASLDLPENRFDGVFANAALFHVPSEHLDRVLADIYRTLKPQGCFFASNAHGFGEDKEGWTSGRTPETRSWVCWLSEHSWKGRCEAAGFQLLETFYRGPTKAFLATRLSSVPISRCSSSRPRYLSTETGGVLYNFLLPLTTARTVRETRSPEHRKLQVWLSARGEGADSVVVVASIIGSHKFQPPHREADSSTTRTMMCTGTPVLLWTRNSGVS